MDTVTPEITFDDFLKVDLRVGTILEAEKVPKSKKLVKLKVDFGELGVRQVLAGVGETYGHPEQLVNFQALFVVNLPPREMMGLQSHGMILAVRTNPGDLALFGRYDLDAPNGSKVG